MIEKQYCAHVAEGEPLIGTASRADIWCLLEYTQRWHEYAVKDSALSLEVKTWLAEAQRRYSTLRIQFIKQHNRPLQTITCYFAITYDHYQALYRFQLATYEELLHIDLPALVNGSACYTPQRSHEMLFLVCTHGKHDLCCAKFGLPIYSEATRCAGASAWQITHIGGDKFAANILCLPHGTYYGRVTLPEVNLIIEATRNNRVHLARYRGRSCYNDIVQAGDYFLRRQTGMLDLDAFSLASREEVGDKLYHIAFLAEKSARMHRVTVQLEPTDVTSYTTCQGLRTSKVNYYRMCSYEVCSRLGLGTG